MVCATGATRALLNFRGTTGGADAGGGVSVRAHGDTNQTAPRGELVHVPPTIVAKRSVRLLTRARKQLWLSGLGGTAGEPSPLE